MIHPLGSLKVFIFLTFLKIIILKRYFQIPEIELKITYSIILLGIDFLKYLSDFDENVCIQYTAWQMKF